MLANTQTTAARMLPTKMKNPTRRNAPGRVSSKAHTPSDVIYAKVLADSKTTAARMLPTKKKNPTRRNAPSRAFSVNVTA